MKRICVFSGSSYGSKPRYGAAAKNLGRVLTEKKICLVYGGAKVGLMGVMAKAVLDAGGDVTGVISRELVFFDHAVERKFIDDEHRRMIVIEDDPIRLIEKFKEYKPPKSDKAKWAIKMIKDID